jgi:cytochrome c oxidase subunit II
MKLFFARAQRLAPQYGLAFVFALLALLVFLPLSSMAEIGDAARKRYEEIQSEPNPNGGLTVAALMGYVKVFIMVVLLLTLVVVNRIFKLTKFNPFSWLPANNINAVLFIVFLLGGSYLVIWQIVNQSNLILPPSASEHGKLIDRLFLITTAFILPAFFVFHVLLFGFAYLYRSKPGVRATYVHENSQLELTFMGIVAVLMVGLGYLGVQAWNRYHYTESAQEIQIAITGEQFQWRMRYAGKDGKLGTYNYRRLVANPYGLDSNEVVAKDDIVPSVKEIYLPVNVQVRFKIKAKDVMHGFYVPHFRAHVYAVPGMGTETAFVPTITTEEMRTKLNNPKFDFELACSQLCGASHYNMRAKLVVVSREAYDKWLSEQGTFNPAPTEEKLITSR